ncbi:MAG: hypothetical protein EOO89_32885, partial [Pedobacter sp.]
MTTDNGKSIKIETVEYNAAGQVQKLSGNDNGYRIYEYNATGNLSGLHAYYKLYGEDDVTYQTYSTFDYNTNGQLIKSSEFNILKGNTLSGYSIYSYPSTNSVYQKYFEMNNGIPVAHSEIAYEFDDKKAINSLIGVLRVGHLQYDALSSNVGYLTNDALLSEHNLLSCIITMIGHPNNPTIKYAYTFNPSGYPTKRLKNGSSEETALVSL